MTIWHIIGVNRLIIIIFPCPSTDCIFQSIRENQFSSPQSTETTNYKRRTTEHRKWNH